MLVDIDINSFLEGFSTRVSPGLIMDYTDDFVTPIFLLEDKKVLCVFGVRILLDDVSFNHLFKLLPKRNFT